MGESSILSFDIHILLFKFLWFVLVQTCRVCLVIFTINLYAGKPNNLVWYLTYSLLKEVSRFDRKCMHKCSWIMRISGEAGPTNYHLRVIDMFWQFQNAWFIPFLKVLCKFVHLQTKIWRTLKKGQHNKVHSQFSGALFFYFYFSWSGQKWKIKVQVFMCF